MTWCQGNHTGLGFGRAESSSWGCHQLAAGLGKPHPVSGFSLPSEVEGLGRRQVSLPAWNSMAPMAPRLLVGDRSPFQPPSLLASVFRLSGRRGASLPSRVWTRTCTATRFFPASPCPPHAFPTFVCWRGFLLYPVFHHIQLWGTEAILFHLTSSWRGSLRRDGCKDLAPVGLLC